MIKARRTGKYLVATTDHRNPGMSTSSTLAAVDRLRKYCCAIRSKFACQCYVSRISSRDTVTNIVSVGWNVPTAKGIATADHFGWSSSKFTWLLLLLLSFMRLQAHTVGASASYTISLKPDHDIECFIIRVPSTMPFTIRYVVCGCG
jgi:hypothetical protein